ncbi:MAG: mucin desulfatase, partial [Limisphaerales bacterium]
MARKLELDLRPLAKEFQILAEFLDAEPCSRGHINDTYAATYNQAGRPVRYIHQRINHHVFTDPHALMQNLERVTTHLRAKLSGNGDTDVTRQVLTLVPARDGKAYCRDAAGNFWRTYLFIEKVQTFDAVEKPDQAHEAGKAFGNFQKTLVDLPGERLNE